MPTHDRAPEIARQDFGDLGELLAEATERTVLDQAPGKSGARLERVVIRGQPYVLKRLDLADDWTMRASGCLRGAPFELWERGILGRLPGCFNQPIVAVAREDPTAGTPSGGCAAAVLGPLMAAGLGLGFTLAPSNNTGTFGVAGRRTGAWLPRGIRAGLAVRRLPSLRLPDASCPACCGGTGSGTRAWSR